MPMSPRLLRPRATGFTPRSITGLALWLDASDASTLFQDAAATTPATATSDPVGAWLDKSGNARHATQSTAANRPVIHSATQNNRKILSFDGSNDALLGTGAQALKTGMTVIGAYFSGNVNYSSLFCVGEAAAGKRWLSGSSLSKVGIDYYTNALSVQADARNRTGITSFTLNPSANSLGIRMDGAQVLSQASLSPALAAYTSDTFAVGTVPLANEQWLAGRIFELAVYNRVLSAAECRRVEQALATKWGITLAPQVANADAQDWVNRVYANGGTVSSSTAAAVSTFCDAIDAASIRDRFLRMNLFCGSNLNAALVPLYRSASFGGSPLGNATDTNLGSPAFLVGDYNETGVNAGLNGNGSSKYLDTGLNLSQLPSIATGHLSILKGAGSAFGVVPIGVRNAASDQYFRYDQTGPSGNNRGLWGNVIIANAASNTSRLYAIVSRTDSNALTVYHDGTSVATSSTAATPALPGRNLFVFAENSGSAGSFWAHAIQAYSVGLSLDAGQALALSNAMATFQASLVRS